MNYFLFRRSGEPVPALDDRAQDRGRRRILPLGQHLRPLSQAAGLLHRGGHARTPTNGDQGEGIPPQLKRRREQAISSLEEFCSVFSTIIVLRFRVIMIASAPVM